MSDINKEPLFKRHNGDNWFFNVFYAWIMILSLAAFGLVFLFGIVALAWFIRYVFAS